MPGYKPLPPSVTGPGADQARQAESRHRGGDPAAATQLFEEIRERSVQLMQPIPGWLCGRLAALYRTLGRYDDEVQLLEEYRDSQVDEEARTRYDARLSKARTIADRKRKPDTSGALESVRALMRRPRRNRRVIAADGVTPLPSVFSQVTVRALTFALLAAAPDDSSQMKDAIALVCAEAHANDVSVHEVVALLRSASVAAAGLNEGTSLDSRGDSVLLLLLAVYYKAE